MENIKLFNHDVKILSSYTDTLENENWFKLLNIKQLHEQGFKGERLKIAVIDTGCQITHPIFNGKSISGSNFTPEMIHDIPYWDANGHGTFCASIISTICPNAEILICKVLDSSGNGSYDSIIAGLNFAIDQNVDVISMSLGGKQHQDGLYEAVVRAINKNILIVSAAGNDSHNDIDVMEYSYPGSYNEVTQVGACDYDLNIASFSNNNNNMDVISYGVDIVGAGLNSNYVKLSGTSMATPMVAGLSLLLKQKYEKEFQRKISESELYGSLIKNTETIDGIPRWGQGFGRAIYLNK